MFIPSFTTCRKHRNTLFWGREAKHAHKWIPCGEKFIVGDVVRWKEAVWVEKGKRKKKLIKVGERRVTAEVLGTDRKWGIRGNVNAIPG